MFSQGLWAAQSASAGARIVIHAPKTEHHGEEHASREIPIFGEIRPYLEQQLTDLLEDFDPKAKSLSKEFVIRRYRQQNNLRTQLSKIIRRAGLIPWPKLYQNCRVTSKNELRDLGFDPETICAWLGHDARTAFSFYHEPTIAEFAKAANLQIPMQSGAVSGPPCIVRKEEPLPITEDYEGLLNGTSNMWAMQDRKLLQNRLGKRNFRQYAAQKTAHLTPASERSLRPGRNSVSTGD